MKMMTNMIMIMTGLMSHQCCQCKMLGGGPSEFCGFEVDPLHGMEVHVQFGIDWRSVICGVMSITICNGRPLHTDVKSFIDCISTPITI